MEYRGFNRLHKVYKSLSEEETLSVSSKFSDYYRSLKNNPRKLLRMYRYIGYIFKVLEGHGKRILDIGCGYGHYSIIFGILGAVGVVGVDLQEDCINGFKKLLSVDRSLNNVRVELGNETHVSFDEDFDIVFCNEMISHVREVEPFLTNISRFLRGGGTLFLSDGNNLLNPYSVWRSIRKGMLCEYKGRVACADFKPSYREQRELIIKKEFPFLDDATATVLIEKRRGCMAIRYPNRAQISFKLESSLLNHLILLDARPPDYVRRGF